VMEAQNKKLAPPPRGLAAALANTRQTQTPWYIVGAKTQKRKGGGELRRWRQDASRIRDSNRAKTAIELTCPGPLRGPPDLACRLSLVPCRSQPPRCSRC
jgi:hypothetical protein